MGEVIIQEPIELAAPDRPIHIRWPVLNPLDGRITEVDVVVASPESWAAMPQSSLPNWGFRHTRGLVVAIRVVS